MNALVKSIKAEQDYILRDAVRATPEEYPQLCRIFADIKRRNPCGKRLTLMVGKSDSSGLAIRRSPHTGVILIDRKDASLMTEQEIRFLVGHEHGHFDAWREFENRTAAPDHEHLPRPLQGLFSRISSEIYADLAGVDECRSTFVAGEYLSAGDHGMERIYNNPLDPLPEKVYGDLELAVRIQALGLLAKSEYFYELIGSELFGYGKWQMTAEEYFERMDHLFDPYMNFTDEDGRALGAFIAGALFIAGCKVGDVRWHRELDRLADFGDPVELLSYASKDQAYDRILSVADRVRNISHPLKHIAWDAVWDLTYREWDDADEGEKFDDFIDYVDGRDKTAA